MTRLLLALVTAFAALIATTPAGAAVPPRQDRPLRNVDVRTADGGPVTATQRRRAAPAADIALDYVRARPDVFGLDASDLDALRLDGRYRSPDGVTHLSYTQTYRGVGAYDNVLLANVDDDGRLLNVGGAAVPDLPVASVVPGLDAQA